MVFTSFCITYDQIEKTRTAERDFLSTPMIKTALADFLGHPTSRAGADALHADAWLSPWPLSQRPSSAPHVGSAFAVVDKEHPL
jgi:hypothetical protein